MMQLQLHTLTSSSLVILFPIWEIRTANGVLRKVHLTGVGVSVMEKFGRSILVSSWVLL